MPGIEPGKMPSSLRITLALLRSALHRQASPFCAMPSPPMLGFAAPSFATLSCAMPGHAWARHDLLQTNVRELHPQKALSHW